MWLFSKIGFLSIVEHRDKPGTLLVRARFQKDIETFCSTVNELTETPVTWSETPDADYRFRACCPREIFAKVAARIVNDIDYDNFKDAVHDGTVRDSAYMSCWSAMRGAQERGTVKS